MGQVLIMFIDNGLGDDLVPKVSILVEGDISLFESLIPLFFVLFIICE